jgi:DNA replication protein DnaC
MNDIHHYCDTLKLPYIREAAEREASDSLRRKDTYTDYLKRLLQQEVLNRLSRAIQVKIKKAQFPSMKTWEAFDMKVLPNADSKAIAKLMTGEYINHSENVIYLGSSGTGKTHLAIALGLAACQQGHTVLFQTAAHLVHSLIEAHDARKLLSLQRKLMMYKVLIIDAMLVHKCFLK